MSCYQQRLKNILLSSIENISHRTQFKIIWVTLWRNYFADSNWSKYKAGLDVPEFHDTIEAFQDYNQTVIHKVNINQSEHWVL